MPDPTSALSIGEMVANGYRVLGMAGAGGMGVVYRARDIKLERTVALKFLPAELNASEREKQRFLREARTASVLDHPNIGVIHGIEETADGRSFIVMAFYEGQSLAQRIRSGAMSAREAVEIALQVAHGLAEAHAHNIVHRDIKPSNVMLTGAGQVKIVDFGLAHVLSVQTATETGITGTVAYMSPEQTLGNAVDHRTDIWSLGVVLAEMLTGRNPLDRDTIPATVVAILNEPPRALDGVPVELQHIVYRALSKDPVNRYQECAEIIADLEQVQASDVLPREGAAAGGVSASPSSVRRARPSSAIRRSLQNASKSAWRAAPQPGRNWTPWLLGLLALLLACAGLLLVPRLRHGVESTLFAPREQHIAVLPFDSVGSTPENDALVQGLMDSMAAKLSNLDVGNKSLWVVPTSEVRRRKIGDPTAALKELGANLVVKGTVQRDGQSVHLMVNLIDAKNLRQIGSADLEDESGDLATLQNDAVSRLAKLMKVNVTPGALRTTADSLKPAAYEDYLTALGYMERYDKPGNLDQALETLENAVKTDPRFALGYAQLGEAYRLKYQVERDPKWIERAQANCKMAAELDPRIPSVYVTLGKLHDEAGNHELALQEFQHAINLDAKNAEALTGLASAYENAGHVGDAEAAYKKAVALRPDNWDGYNSLGLFYDRQGRFAEAITALRKAIDLTPDNAQAYLNLAAAYIDSSDPKQQAEAARALQRSIALSPSYPAYANLGMLYMQQKRFAESIAATEKALQLNANDYLVWNNLALAYASLHDNVHADAARHKAEERAEEHVRLKPQDSLTQSVLAALYAKDKLRDQALAHLQTCLALNPTEAGAFSNVGEAYELMGNRALALEYIHKALRDGYPLDQVTGDPELQALIKDGSFRPTGK